MSSMWSKMPNFFAITGETLPVERARLPRHPGLGVVGQQVDRVRQAGVGDVGDGDVLDDVPEALAYGDPHARQLAGHAGVLGLLGLPAADGRQRALDGPDDVGNRDLAGLLGQSKAAVGAALAAHQSGDPELREDVLEEVERKSL